MMIEGAYMHRNTYVKIDLNTLENNVKNIVNYYDNYKYYIGVVKANAYGYGEEIVSTITKRGINYLAVSNLDEALNVRSYVDTPILCLEPIPFKYLDTCIKKNITITLSNYDDYKDLKKENINGLKIHLKIDSGMHRLGFTNKKIVKEVYDDLKSNIEGIYTHLATSGIYDKKYDKQIKTFEDITSLIDLSKIKIVHVGRSATIVNHDKLPYVNGTRIGILMYGITPNNIIYTGLMGKIKRIKRDLYLKKNNISKTNLICPIKVNQCFKLISEIIEIKEVKAGESVGYGMSNITNNNIKIGIIPVGYADGFDIRNTGNYVRINKSLCKIIGSVNSGMITVIINDNVKIHDEVEVIYDVKKTASYTNQTVYTVTSSINSNVKRIYEGKDA